MREFDMIVKGEIVLRDVVYAKADGSRVIIKDVWKTQGSLKNYGIRERLT